MGSGGPLARRATTREAVTLRPDSRGSRHRDPGEVPIHRRDHAAAPRPGSDEPRGGRQRPHRNRKGGGRHRTSGAPPQGRPRRAAPGRPRRRAARNGKRRERPQARNEPVQNLTAARLYEDQRDELQLEPLTESLASKREITVSDIHRPGMALMGFVENFLPERIQIIAQTELTYLATLTPKEVKSAIDRLFQFDKRLIGVCKGLAGPTALIDRPD